MRIDEIERRLTDFLAYIPYDMEDGKKDCEAIEEALSMIKDYQTIKFNYDKKLREDIKNILIGLLSDIESLPTVRNYITDNQGATYGYTEYAPSIEDVSKLIRQKIDSLKVESEG